MQQHYNAFGRTFARLLQKYLFQKICSCKEYRYIFAAQNKNNATH
jgi:hypothetical protein